MTRWSVRLVLLLTVLATAAGCYPAPGTTASVLDAATRRPRATTTTSTSTTSTTLAPTTSGRLFYSDYASLTNLLSPLPAWQAEQEVAADRMTVVDGAHGRVMRAEVRPGDAYGSSAASRVEVYARHPKTGTSPSLWPDPPGSTRWYGFDVYVPADFVTDTTGLVWFSFTQWKGEYSGQPAIALEVKRDRIEMAGASARNDLGPLKKGQWERFVVGVHFDPTTAGWVEVYRNGVQALGRTFRPTTNWVTLNGVQVADPTYLKQGIYRDPRWTVTHTLQFGPTTIGLSRSDVD